MNALDEVRRSVSTFAHVFGEGDLNAGREALDHVTSQIGGTETIETIEAARAALDRFEHDPFFPVKEVRVAFARLQIWLSGFAAARTDSTPTPGPVLWGCDEGCKITPFEEDGLYYSVRTIPAPYDCPVCHSGIHFTEAGNHAQMEVLGTNGFLRQIELAASELGHGAWSPGDEIEVNGGHVYLSWRDRDGDHERADFPTEAVWNETFRRKYIADRAKKALISGAKRALQEARNRHASLAGAVSAAEEARVKLKKAEEDIAAATLKLDQIMLTDPSAE